LSEAELQRWCAPSQLIDDISNVFYDATEDGRRPSIIVAHSYSTSLVTQWLAALEREAGGDRRFDSARAAHSRHIFGVILLNTHASLPPLAQTRSATLARRLPTALQLAAVDLMMGPVRWLRMLCGGDCSHGSLGERATLAARARWLAWERRKSAWLYASSVCSVDWAREQDFARAYAALPVAISWGERDDLTPVDRRFMDSRQRRLAPALSALKVFEGHGHWQFLDNPEFDEWFLAARARILLNVCTPLLEVPVERLGAEALDVSGAPHCVVCGAIARYWCGRCAKRRRRADVPRYCDADCQQLHWERGHCDACVK